MKPSLMAISLGCALLWGCGAIPAEKSRTLNLEVAVSDDHQSMSLRNNGSLTLDHLDVTIYTHDRHTYIFKFPEDTLLPPGKKASFLLSNCKEEKTGEAFAHWDQIYRIVVHTPTEYWSGGGGSR